MRGVVVALVVIFSMAMVLFVAGASVEPLGEHIKGYSSIDEGEMQGTSVINDVYDTVFIYSPLIMIFGIPVVWATAWYLRRERFIGGRGP